MALNSCNRRLFTDLTKMRLQTLIASKRQARLLILFKGGAGTHEQETGGGAGTHEQETGGEGSAT